MSKKVTIETNENIVVALRKASLKGNKKSITEKLGEDDKNIWINTVEAVYRTYTEYSAAKYAKCEITSSDETIASSIFAIGDFDEVNKLENKCGDACTTLLNRIGMRYNKSFLTSLAGVLEMWRMDSETKRFAPFIRCRGSVLIAVERLCGYLLTPTGMLDNFQVWKSSVINGTQKKFDKAAANLKTAQTGYDASHKAYSDACDALADIDSIAISGFLETLEAAADSAYSKLNSAQTAYDNAKDDLDEINDRTPEEWENLYHGKL